MIELANLPPARQWRQGPTDERPRHLNLSSDRDLTELESIDDAVWNSLHGDADALAELHMLWPQAVATMPASIVDESREQYIRYAVRTWQQQGPSNAELTVAALDVLSLLLEDESHDQILPLNREPHGADTVSGR